jgi:hypothetical protein
MDCHPERGEMQAQPQGLRPISLLDFLEFGVDHIVVGRSFRRCAGR